MKPILNVNKQSESFSILCDVNYDVSICCYCCCHCNFSDVSNSSCCRYCCWFSLCSYDNLGSMHLLQLNKHKSFFERNFLDFIFFHTESAYCFSRYLTLSAVSGQESFFSASQQQQQQQQQ